jgi:hypothetical protein
MTGSRRWPSTAGRLRRNGRPFLATKLIKGETLDELVKRHASAEQDRVTELYDNLIPPTKREQSECLDTLVWTW